MWEFLLISNIIFPWFFWFESPLWFSTLYKRKDNTTPFIFITFMKLLFRILTCKFFFCTFLKRNTLYSPSHLAQHNKFLGFLLLFSHCSIFANGLEEQANGGVVSDQKKLKISTYILNFFVLIFFFFFLEKWWSTYFLFFFLHSECYNKIFRDHTIDKFCIKIVIKLAKTKT